MGQINTIGEENTARIDTNIMLGKFCSINPNICMYANNMLTQYEEPVFTSFDWPFILQQWANTPSDQSINDFSDAYWIAKCWIKHWRANPNEIERNSQLRVATPKSIIYLRCNQLVERIPEVELRGIPGCMLWVELNNAIETIKCQLRYIYPITPKHNIIVKPQTTFGPVFEARPQLQELATGEITIENQSKFNEAADELMDVVEMWINVIDRNDNIETRLMKFIEETKNKNNKSNNNNKINKVETENDVKQKADLTSELCDVYWMFKSWQVSVESMDRSDVDADVFVILDYGKDICELIDGMDLYDFTKVETLCDKLAKARLLLREQFRFMNSMEELYDAIYGAAERAD